MFCKNTLSGTLSGIGTEKGSETPFQTAKLDHANAPNVCNASELSNIWYYVNTGLLFEYLTFNFLIKSVISEHLPRLPQSVGLCFCRLYQHVKA